jgi:hypothetical protein
MSDALSITEIRAMAFVDREKQTFSRYAELFPNYEWTDSATAIDLMAAEIKCLRSELLDACRLATSLRGFAGPMMVRATTKPASWVEWKKTCARLVDLLIEIRARWYAGTFSGREQKCWKMPARASRGKDRSRTYRGIAEAMAEQWGRR